MHFFSETSRFLAALLIAVSLVACVPGEDAPHPGTLAFDQLSREFLDWYLRDDPVRATSLGVHDADDRWPPLTRESILRNAQEWHAWLDRLETIARDDLTGIAYQDHRILEYGIRAAILESEEVRSWARNPNHYNSLLARGVTALVDRDFAPLAVRIEALTARLSGVGTVLEAARENLVDTPRIWVDLAVVNVRGTAQFLREDLPLALEQQGLADLDAEEIATLNAAIAAAAAELDRFELWLSGTLAPRSTGDFRLGADLFRRKLLYEEHYEFDLDALAEMNESAINDYRAWVEREAASIDDGIPAAEVMELITHRFPASDKLIETAAGFVEQARAFVIEHELLTLPSDELPIIRPTPRFARSGFASMSTPGPFEQQATEAYYNITTVDPSWTVKQQEEHLTYFNFPGLLGVSIHEVMPGHFVQLLYRQQVPSELRKIFMPRSLIEGWAHYTEQMMIDEGLGGGNAAVRLGQLRRALQRHARWHVCMAMHVSGESILESAIDFAEIAYFADFPALRETQRATYDPTYLYYALGRMEILRLREDYRAYLESHGKTFSMREFHDSVLALGLPLPLLREHLIPG